MVNDGDGDEEDADTVAVHSVGGGLDGCGNEIGGGFDAVVGSVATVVEEFEAVVMSKDRGSVRGFRCNW